MVRKYRAEIIQHHNLIDNIYILEFKSLGRKFKFLPGQFLHLAIDEYDGVGQWPESRCFSMQSNPKESTIRITYAVKGGFTKRMAIELSVGVEVWLKLPYGTLFETDHSLEKAIFIAGGTGITPYLSLFTNEAFADYKQPCLFFGIREKKFNLYKEELSKAKKINSSLDVKMYIEAEDGRPGINDIINTQSLGSSFFISGPPAMIEFYKNSLINNGVERERIITDDWE